jgi:putative ubiquitin-RnfH superfamily antitoxin RatB of RatAB toxin-antitoxin module
MADAEPIRVTVLYSPAPREVHQWELVLPPGATVRDAVQASGLAALVPGVDLASTAAGVWGRKAPPQQVLRCGDRVELYRPLKIDPKLARRERFRQQGVRAAGLFTRKKGDRAPRG